MGGLGKVMAWALCPVVAVLAAPAAAGAAAVTFEGSCDIAGVSRYDRPMTAQVTDNVSRSVADGWCSGSVNGDDDAQHPVTTTLDVAFRGSCYDAASTTPGRAVVRFHRGTPRLEDDAVLVTAMTFRTDPFDDVVYELRGETSGLLRGSARYTELGSTPRNVVACHTGGLRESRFTASGRTVSKLVSPAPAPPSTPARTGLDVAVVGTDLRRALARGLRVRCFAAGPVLCRLSASIGRSTARRYGLTRRRLGSTVVEIPSGADSVLATIPVPQRARRALSRAPAVRVHVTASVRRDGSLRRSRAARRLVRR